MSSVAIITARGGSKRIPRKNVRPFLGIPVISYPIKAALEARCFDEVMVSTDDAEIADIARSAGAVVPFFRSARNSDDNATTADVLVEVLTEYRNRQRLFETACCIYPTAPLITAQDLITGSQLLRDNQDVDAAIPVVRFSYPIQRALQIQANRLSMIWPENVDKRSQDLLPAYHDAGQFYWIRVAAFLETRKLFMPRTAPIVLSEYMVQDIDNEDDWRLGETKYEMLRRQSGTNGSGRAGATSGSPPGS